ncbi:MAG TPA: hypothetical protein VME67_16625 [Mycobacterium sp.]|nr:hypothetical protein [Mycobacterium sp.]
MTAPQSRETGGQPEAAVLRVPFVSPWLRPPIDANLPGFLVDGINDARRYSGQLERNGEPGASEFSIGAGQVAPWIRRRARAQRRYPQPSDGYSTPYRGTSPPTDPDTNMRRGELRRELAAMRRGRGSEMLHRALRQNG